ncbi:hypothetical protein J4H86_01540 [Spiractinospora alimapuensis]|nr:hypothetical protein [Spiractinospora alimapuensis]QVQ52557.1 hypothetical protein J4H86_01540 [Spiractinospora alimapuensis]
MVLVEAGRRSVVGVRPSTGVGRGVLHGGGDAGMGPTDGACGVGYWA